MSKKHSKLAKTLVEKILDQAKIPYTQYELVTQQEGDVRQLKLDELALNEHMIYKTLALTGKTSGPIIGVVPLDERISYKKLAKITGNRKVGMVPLKELVATTGYEHGANTPIGIHQTHHHYPIIFSNSAQNQTEILVSSGKIGRSIKVAPAELVPFLGAKFADITEDD
ncbi:aminoacyl-tRNA deacylase [Loigolactobacillus backii]|uniref:Cys-tRNA(Pro)/Cys-tRNA(Cys) deacylase n=1 Tax=Loigolactobacillus backii TaxID=375175 RepID=A0A192H4P3_9LACO|nr:aminoacyl-tRNA deacylase [Loigolactobacillus backii]ANK59780.1 aminoacyl-tRNA deacylase [Loigolactobacillus backii]ANK63182.1 aminoacyl-tRNA deacylase [Loigolactobacillus backii]ANK66776.1 aminoacyl-tRNA deacylase [Loigolactobacillus backii]ANK69812.1 aminoacyl-tRNA deacylase [Loigolactobacillus backii]MDA5387630.1 aminoacyl-tRNA deacylase [Loigolactobacillus backii]